MALLFTQFLDLATVVTIREKSGYPTEYYVHYNDCKQIHLLSSVCWLLAAHLKTIDDLMSGLRRVVWSWRASRRLWLVSLKHLVKALQSLREKYEYCVMFFTSSSPGT